MADHNVIRSFDEQISDWVKRIGSFQKKASNSTWLSIGIGVLGGILSMVLLNSFVFNKLPDFYYGWIINFLIMYLLPFIIYFAWPFPMRKKFIRQVTTEVNNAIHDNGYEPAAVIRGLVKPLIANGICSRITRKIDPLLDKEIRQQVINEWQTPSVQPVAGNNSSFGQQTTGASTSMQASPQAVPFTSYDQLEYVPIETPVGTTRIQFVCPACFEPNEVAMIDILEMISSHVGNLYVRYSGQSLKTVSSGMAKWGIPIIVASIVFLGALLFGVNFQMACITGIVIGFFGGFFILKPILESMVGSLVSKKTPIWLVACKNCKTEIPFATVNGQVGMGKMNFPPQAAASPAGIQPKTEARGFHMPIDNVFIMQDRGAVVSGVVRSGSIKAGMPVNVIRKDKSGEPLQTEVIWLKPFFGENEFMTTPVPGAKLNILLKDLGAEDVHAGDRLQK